MERLTTGQAAKVFQVSAETVRRWIHKGLFPAERATPLSPHRIHRNDIEKYARERSLTLKWHEVEKSTKKTL